MRDNLIGHLLGAIEPSEHELIERRLCQDAKLRDELAVLRESLTPLAHDTEAFDPPAGLAARTCNFVAARAARAPSTAASGYGNAGSGSWRLHDWLIAAGICVAASMLLFPAVANSRFNSQLTACQNNLRMLGNALAEYSDANHRYYPCIPFDNGRLAVAGIYGPTLSSAGLIEDAPILVCPSSSLATEIKEGKMELEIPTLEQLNLASQDQLDRYHLTMGGSYGYSFGYMSKGRYHGHRNSGRAQFALMADSPNEQDSGPSSNHGSAGQNVLFDDGHVEFLRSCRLSKGDDHIYQNDHGYVGPGIHQDDAVIGRSPARAKAFQTRLAE